MFANGCIRESSITSCSCVLLLNAPNDSKIAVAVAQNFLRFLLLSKDT